jgi:hypothetical protein
LGRIWRNTLPNVRLPPCTGNWLAIMAGIEYSFLRARLGELDREMQQAAEQLPELLCASWRPSWR